MRLVAPEERGLLTPAGSDSHDSDMDICLNKTRFSTLISLTLTALLFAGCGTEGQKTSPTTRPEVVSPEPSLSTNPNLRELTLTLAPHDSRVFEIPKPTATGLALTVTDDELVRIRIDKLEQQILKKAPPKVEQLDRMVCTDPYRVCLKGAWELKPELRTKKTKEKVCVKESEPHCTLWQGTVNKNAGGPLVYPKDKDHPCFKHTPQEMRCSPPVAGRCVTFGTTCLEHKEVEVEKPVLGPFPAPPDSLLGVRIEGDKPKTTEFYRWVCMEVSKDLCPPGKWENQFVRITTFSPLRPETEYAPLEVTVPSLERLASELVLRFQNKAPVDGESEECPLSTFEPKVFSPHEIAFRMRNRPDCHVFHAGNRVGVSRPTVAFSSFAHLTEAWPCGIVIDSWDGNRSYRCLRPDGSVDAHSVKLPEANATKENPYPSAYTTQVFPRVRAHVRIDLLNAEKEPK